MRVMTAAPPPTLTPRTSSRVASGSSMTMSTVLGCSASRRVSRTNSTSRPRSRAMENESRISRSHASKPSMPATSALSVPCPEPVCANDPYNVKVTRGGCAHRFRAIFAMASAPAVCELEGPTMTGPMMSRRPNVFMLTSLAGPSDRPSGRVSVILPRRAPRGRAPNPGCGPLASRWAIGEFRRCLRLRVHRPSRLALYGATGSRRARAALWYVADCDGARAGLVPRRRGDRAGSANALRSHRAV